MVFDYSWIYNNERKLWFIFTTNDIPEFSFIDQTLQGQTTTITFEETINDSDTLWWNPIPYEFLYQDVETS